ncbi:MAG: hypothetical protein DMG82_16605 [Acidobacteria bacterium]|nr:MAG: hypothetical protein DMG82_16605 [Acidobacteriota bacterium]PYX45701.1 MAG: hypothetical protein DMG83_09055 [Acidobacteriota bacterium]
MTKVIDRLAHGEGRGFMTALGRQPGAGRLRELLLTLYGYVVMPEHVHLLLSEPNCPTQAKIGLEWATRGREPGAPAVSIKSPALPSEASFC